MDGSTEPFLPDQPYVSLFHSSIEVPQFDFHYPYWACEAKIILMGYDVKEIGRLIRYGLFYGDLHRRVLRHRNKKTVKEFLLDLVPPQEAGLFVELSQDEQVEEIIRRSRVARIPLLPWAWLPSLQLRDSDPQAIAAAIDAESHVQFSRIPFEEWVRYSLGFRVISIEWFLQQHTNFYIHLLTYLSWFPDEIEKYIEVGKVCRKISI